jgi:hypothetical protein
MTHKKNGLPSAARFASDARGIDQGGAAAGSAFWGNSIM